MSQSQVVATIPLIIRGKVIRDGWKAFSTRSGGTFHSPDVRDHLQHMILQSPGDLEDLYAVSLDEIVNYLVALGRRMQVTGNPHLQLALDIQLRSTSSHTAEMTRGLFAALPGLLKREVIEECLEKNIGKQFLEGWVDVPMLQGRMVGVRAFGARTVHVIAGNASVIALQTIMFNALTRGDAIIKLPSNDPYFAAAVALTMIEMAPEHPLTRHLSVAYWKGGDRTIESFLYDSKHIEKIVAWGGFDSMRSIREYLAPGIDLVALDPKLSASIVGKEAFESEETMRAVAILAARDIAYFNQGGCVSARTLYVESGVHPAGVAAANRFGELVFEAIQEFPPQFSTPHPAFDPVLRDELEGIRYSDAFRVIGGKRNEGAIIVSQDDELVDFSNRLDCRVANIVPVANVAAALAHLTIHTQTIGIYPDSLRKNIRNACALRGGQRMVPLGFATVGTAAGPHDAIEPMRRMVRWIRDDDVREIKGTLFAN